MFGDVKINGVDAFEQWGLNLEDGALSALMAPPAMKEYVESTSRSRHGKVIITDNAKYASRELTLPFHITARTKDAFFTKYQKFCDEVLSKGAFTITTKYQPEVVYKLVYVSCTQFRQFQQKLGVFSLKVEEPNPTDRSNESDD